MVNSGVFSSWLKFFFIWCVILLTVKHILPCVQLGSCKVLVQGRINAKLVHFYAQKFLKMKFYIFQCIPGMHTSTCILQWYIHGLDQSQDACTVLSPVQKDTVIFQKLRLICLLMQRSQHVHRISSFIFVRWCYMQWFLLAIFCVAMLCEEST